MICSFVLGLRPKNGEEEKIYKYINYDYLKEIILKEFSSNELKKVTISNFLTKDRTFEDKIYYIKISSIDSECTLKLFKLLFFYKITNHIISIKNIDFKIINIYHNSFWAKQLDIKKIMLNELKNEIKIRFLTPVFFKIGNEYVSSVEPIYVFKNLIKKIKMSSLYNENILKNIESFKIDKVKVEEKLITKSYIGKLNTVGIIGEVIFKMESFDKEQLLLFNLLLYFAFFSGIGYLTEKGYGQNTSNLDIV